MTKNTTKEYNQYSEHNYWNKSGNQWNWKKTKIEKYTSENQLSKMIDKIDLYSARHTKKKIRKTKNY